MQANTEFFLGANTPRGFVSFFDELYNPYKTSGAYIIKGGPGTGKSTFMKKIADRLEQKGITTQRIYCASDPSSLDAVIAEDIDFCIADGTSPHTLEPKFPGAAENIINLGQFWDEAKLKEKREKIIALTVENSLHHRRSAAYLSAAGSIDAQTAATLEKYISEDKIESFAVRLAHREGPHKKTGPGKMYRRFLSAITPEGTVFLDSTLKALAYRVIALEDRYSPVSRRVAMRVGEKLLKNGYDVIFCYCPLEPTQVEHIIVPETGFALISTRKEHGITAQADRVIHCERFMNKDFAAHRQLLRINISLRQNLVEEGCNMLRKARQTHDILEKEYIQAMDFARLDEFCRETVNKITADI